MTDRTDSGSVVHGADMPLFDIGAFRTELEDAQLGLRPAQFGTSGLDVEGMTGVRHVLRASVAPSKPRTVSPWSVRVDAKRRPSSLADALYDSRASFKLRVANVAMHLSTEWRKKFFKQVDSLLDEDEWDERDLPITDSSFVTLIRTVLFTKAKRRPGLGATSNGHVIAAWTTVSDDRLTIECLGDDVVRWTVVIRVGTADDRDELAAGETWVERLLEVLAPYGPDRWFDDEG